MKLLLCLFFIILFYSTLMAVFNIPHSVIHRVATKKLSGPLRIVNISDLHGSVFGGGQRRLIDMLERLSPDIVVMSGDLFDDFVSRAGSIELLTRITEKYPCFYVTGNHEYCSGEERELKELARSLGATVLEGKTELVSVRGETISISGVDDPSICGVGFYDQLLRASEGLSADIFSVLVTHRPEYSDIYVTFPFDLVLSGHAHGGQWRIPWLVNGIFAPNQGLFPRMAGGLYALEEQTHIVSRGLAKKYPVPRIFNNPELTAVDVAARFEPKSCKFLTFFV